MNADQDRLTVALAGRYTVEREIGHGGMATVYLAHDLKHHRSVAVKVLKPELATAVGPERFLREIEIAARLNHPHILPLYDSGHTDNTLFYVMPYVEGESLHDRLAREKQLSVHEAINIAREVADALQHAHNHRIVHRDIKPANIMLLSNHAVVSDFGVALLAQAVAPPKLTLSGLTPGTPLYMSPEQAAGADHIDGRSDVYSLGCVLYEMLSGEPPFRGPTPQAILARKLTTHPAPLRDTRESISDLLEQVINKALARTPADRFRSAAEFAEALEAALLEQRSTDSRHPTRGLALAGSGSGRMSAPTAASTEDGRSPVGPIIAFAAAALLATTAVGFLTVTVYDQTLNVPHEYAPTRSDFMFIGAKALVPLVFTTFVIIIGVVAVRQLARLGTLLVPRGVQERTHARRERLSQRWSRWWHAREPGVIAELWFTLAIVASAIVLAPFIARLNAAGDVAGGVFACSQRGVHRSYTLAMATLIPALAVSWYLVFGYLRRRNASGFSHGLARWGGITLICVLVLIYTAPWRLLWTETTRVLVDGERYYLVAEKDAGMLLYNPRTHSVEHYTDSNGRLQRLNTDGYIFEDEQAFYTPDAGC